MLQQYVEFVMTLDSPLIHFQEKADYERELGRVVTGFWNASMSDMPSI